MGEFGRARLKAALSRHYAEQRESVAKGEIEALAAAMVTEGARASEASDKVPPGCARASEASDKVPPGCARAGGARNVGLGHVAFVAAQAHYIPTWTWAAQAALVAVMCALACAAGNASASRLAIGLLSAMTVLVGVPTLHASKRHGVAELEYACPRNAASVLVARLIVLGCSSALAVALMVAATAARLRTGAFDVALWAALPYFLSCAGCLMALRVAPPSTAAALCAVWTLACCGALLVFANTFPDLYAHASLAAWAGASAAAGTWLAREVTMICRAAAAGLDAFSPHRAKTCN